jgi:hypothetical protein
MHNRSSTLFNFVACEGYSIPLTLKDKQLSEMGAGSTTSNSVLGTASSVMVPVELLICESTPNNYLNKYSSTSPAH